MEKIKDRFNQSYEMFMEAILVIWILIKVVFAHMIIPAIILMISMIALFVFGVIETAMLPVAWLIWVLFGKDMNYFISRAIVTISKSLVDKLQNIET